MLVPSTPHHIRALRLVRVRVYIRLRGEARYSVVTCRSVIVGCRSSDLRTIRPAPESDGGR